MRDKVNKQNDADGKMAKVDQELSYNRAMLKQSGMQKGKFIQGLQACNVRRVEK